MGEKVVLNLSDRLKNLLATHGPEDIDVKLAYIVSAFDGILKEAKARWTETLSRDEWNVLLESCWSHAFAMEVGGSWELDAESCWLCVCDTLPSELSRGEDSRPSLESLKAKLKSANKLDGVALAWMVVRERRRLGK